MAKKVTIAKVYDWVPYGALLVLLMLLYIANVHRVEKKIRKVEQVHAEIEALKRECYTIKQKSMYDGTLIQVVKKVDGVDLKKEIIIPHKIKKDNV